MNDFLFFLLRVLWFDDLCTFSPWTRDSRTLATNPLSIIRVVVSY
jgi:hypothetical protein